MRQKIVIFTCLIVFLISCWIIGSEAAICDISENIVRLHIIANSNSAKDQELKLYIRDCLLNKVRSDDIYDKEYIYENADEITRICNRLIKEKGFNYQARVMNGKYYFPTKTYQNISLPAGEYEAIRIVLGEGGGENWWCVMYPPLCFTNGSMGNLSEEELTALADGMSKEGFDIINNKEDKITIKPAFKLVELWQVTKHKIIQ